MHLSPKVRAGTTYPDGAAKTVGTVYAIAGRTKMPWVLDPELSLRMRKRVLREVHSTRVRLPEGDPEGIGRPSPVARGARLRLVEAARVSEGRRRHGDFKRAG